MFFDNLMLAMSGDEAGNVFRMGQVLGNVDTESAMSGALPRFSFTTSNGRAAPADPYAPGELLDLTQAGAAEIAGQWWLLTRRERIRPRSARRTQVMAEHRRPARPRFAYTP